MAGIDSLHAALRAVSLDLSPVESLTEMFRANTVEDSPERKITIQWVPWNECRSLTVDAGWTVKQLRRALDNNSWLPFYAVLIYNRGEVGAHPLKPETFFDDDRTLLSYGIATGGVIYYVQMPRSLPHN